MSIDVKPKQITKENFSKFGDLISTANVPQVSRKLDSNSPNSRRFEIAKILVCQFCFLLTCGTRHGLCWDRWVLGCAGQAPERARQIPLRRYPSGL